MNYYHRLNKAFSSALHLPLTSDSRYILISDCHRGNGSSNDNFLKNQNLYTAALQYYYNNQFTYIELGDGDELWENRSPESSIDIHSNTFWMMSRFYKKSRLYLLYGNHDMVKRAPDYARKHFSQHSCSSTGTKIPLFPGIHFYEGIILENQEGGNNVYLTHGHQADLLNSRLWWLSRFLVRYLWGPLENAGFLDPTSAAKNNHRKHKTEQHLAHWTKRENHILITGHTHRPMLNDTGKTPYFNTGSCVHPRCITGIEIADNCFTLVKWSMYTREDYSLAIGRTVLAGPICIEDYEL